MSGFGNLISNGLIQQAKGQVASPNSGIAPDAEQSFNASSTGVARESLVPSACGIDLNAIGKSLFINLKSEPGINRWAYEVSRPGASVTLDSQHIGLEGGSQFTADRIFVVTKSGNIYDIKVRGGDPMIGPESTVTNLRTGTKYVLPSDQTITMALEVGKPIRGHNLPFETSEIAKFMVVDSAMRAV